MTPDEITRNEYVLEKTLLAPYTHLLQIKGKKLRVKIALAFNHWLGLPDETLRRIVDIVDMVHTASLLVDDVQDSTALRRGIPAAHLVYGIPLTLNTALHVLFLVMQQLVELHPEAAGIYADEIVDALRGQGTDVYWRDNFVCPTERDYNEMAKRKTGRMFTLGVRLCQLFSDYKSDLCELALLLGLYFQIRDDYCNLNRQEALEEWPGEEDKQADKDSCFCEDLTEGKFSLPIIHAMNSPEKDEILNILRKRTKDNELKKYCIYLLNKVGSLQYTRAVLEDLDQKARAEVARLGGNPAMEAVLHELLSWKLE